MAFGKLDPKQFQDPARNRRARPRRRQYKSAKLIFNDNQSVVDCVLRNISTTGARVQVGGWFDCPEQVLLKISKGLSYSSDVVWSRDNQLGLRFHEQADLKLVGKQAYAQDILDTAKALPVDDLLRSLSSHRHFGDDEVRTAGEGLAHAHAHMIDALRAVLHGDDKRHREKP